MIRICVAAPDALVKALGQLAGQLPGRLEECMEAACSAVEQEARARCPVDTGLLRGSITHAVEVSGAAVTGRVGTEIDYAPYVHEGTGLYARAGNGRKRVPWVYKDLKTGEIRATKGVRARPFLEEAGEAVAPKLAEYFQGILEG